MLTDCFTVIVASRTRLLVNVPFRDETLAKKYYADCLVRYPLDNVELIPPPSRHDTK